MLTSLLGMYLLGYHGLLLDIDNCTLLDVTTFHSVPLGSSHQCTDFWSTRAGSPYAVVHFEFPKVFHLEYQKPNLPAKHGTYHYKKTTGPRTSQGLSCGGVLVTLFTLSLILTCGIPYRWSLAAWFAGSTFLACGLNQHFFYYWLTVFVNKLQQNTSFSLRN